VPFWLGAGSLVSQAPKSYGLERVHNHPAYRHLFPPEIARGLHLMIQGFRGGVRFQARLWAPAQEKLKRWSKAYTDLHAGPPGNKCDPILSYRDGGNFMIIRQRRWGKEDMTHRLKGTSRKIYLFCEGQREMADILSRFPAFGEEKVRPFLRMMVEKRLMFGERDRYLSLAVPANGLKSTLPPYDSAPDGAFARRGSYSF
jgi:hypothetical protein